MKKNPTQQSWYSLQEAADKISRSLKHKVDTLYLINAALDGRLSLFWYTIEAYASMDIDGAKTLKLDEGAYELILDGNSPLRKHLLEEARTGQHDPAKKISFAVRGADGQQFHTMREKRGFIPPGEPKFEPIKSPPRLIELGFTKDYLESFESETEALQKKSDKLHTKEKETLLKLVIGMAIQGYAYDPSKKKSSVPSEIQSDLDLLGLSLDQDTIRKWLKEAQRTLPKR